MRKSLAKIFWLLISMRKVSEIKKKVDKIMAIPKEKWTKRDIEFMKIAQQSKLLDVLKIAGGQL